MSPKIRFRAAPRRQRSRKRGHNNDHREAIVDWSPQQRHLTSAVTNSSSNSASGMSSKSRRSVQQNESDSGTTWRSAPIRTRTTSTWRPPACALTTPAIASHSESSCTPDHRRVPEPWHLRPMATVVHLRRRENRGPDEMSSIHRKWPVPRPHCGEHNGCVRELTRQETTVTQSQHGHDEPHTHEHGHDGTTHAHPHTSHEHEHVEHDHAHAHADGTEHAHPHVHQADLGQEHNHPH